MRRSAREVCAWVVVTVRGSGSRNAETIGLLGAVWGHSWASFHELSAAVLGPTWGCGDAKIVKDVLYD